MRLTDTRYIASFVTFRYVFQWGNSPREFSSKKVRRMTTTATKRQTKSSGSAKQGQAEHATLSELEQQQRELEQAIEAKREKERGVAWGVLSEALPKAAADQPFDSQAVQSALGMLDMSLDDFRQDVANYKAAQKQDSGELEQLGLDDRQLSSKIKAIREDARLNVQKGTKRPGGCKAWLPREAARGKRRGD